MYAEDDDVQFPELGGPAVLPPHGARGRDDLPDGVLRLLPQQPPVWFLIWPPALSGHCQVRFETNLKPWCQIKMLPSLNPITAEYLLL